MFLVGFGTRPEYIKIKPLLKEFDRRGIFYKTVYAGQHTDLLGNIDCDFEYTIEGIMNPQNRLNDIACSLMTVENMFNGIDHLIVQGDTTTAAALAMSAYYNEIPVLHVEAGLRTYDNKNPYPEEVNLAGS